MEEVHWELLAKHLKDELSDPEKEEFGQWIEGSETNRQLLEKVTDIWQNRYLDKELSDEEFLKTIGTDPKQVWAGIETKISQETNGVNSSPDSRDQSSAKNVYGFLKIAASVLLFIGLGWLVNNLTNFDSLDNAQSEWVRSSDESRMLTLSDGTEVWLNKNSSLKYQRSFDGDIRSVALTGEAYFDVSRDESKPFIIHTEHSQVRVLGTSFNVWAPDDVQEVSVTVTSGRVALSDTHDEDKKVVLVKGDLGYLNAHTGEVTQSRNENLNFLSWKTGILQFKNSTLSQVLATLSKHYDVEVSSATSDILSKRITATFDHQSLDEVLQIVSSVHHLHLTEKESGFVLSTKN